MRCRASLVLTLLWVAAAPAAASAQTWTSPTRDPVLERIWQLGMVESQAYPIAQALMDSIGPRLTGSPGYAAAVDWAVKLMGGWGIEARAEQYGTWDSWRRGVSRVDLIEPRVRSLESTMLAFSPGTGGRAVEAPVVVIPPHDTEAEFQAWLPSVAGKVVAIDFPQPTCRNPEIYDQFGTEGARARMEAERQAAQQQFARERASAPGLIPLQLEAAGAAGILRLNNWTRMGVNRIFSTNTTTTPVFDLGCEDYGLVFRLAENGQNPVVSLFAESQFLGEVPVHNVIGVIPGRELPNEYVMFSAHFDSWDGASGATDNGTGSTVMLEAMRILSQVYPQPKRTIVIGLWGGEEQGLNGSRRFVGMNPDMVDGLQALFNQDNGTGRVQTVNMQGLARAGAHFDAYHARLPREIADEVRIVAPGAPSGGGTDNASFSCGGAPGFGLGSISWNYNQDTWHTNRDTFDKIVFEEIRHNATLAAMLAYMASEDPQRISRDRVEGVTWPQCSPGRANSPRADTP